MVTTAFLRAEPPTERIVSDEGVLGGQPVVAGTRVPVRTILAYLRGGHSHDEIREDYPSLTEAGIAAAEAWARDAFGMHWLEAADRRP